MRLAGFPDGVEDRMGIIRMAEDLVTELARITGAGNHRRRPFMAADPADREAEDAKLLDLATLGLHPEEVAQHVEALRPLHRDIVQLVGRGLHPDIHAALLGLLAEPEAGAVRT